MEFFDRPTQRAPRQRVEVHLAFIARLRMVLGPVDLGASFVPQVVIKAFGRTKIADPANVPPLISIFVLSRGSAEVPPLCVAAQTKHGRTCWFPLRHGVNPLIEPRYDPHVN